MNVMMFALAVTGALCCEPVYTIDELHFPIRYVDKEQGYFIGIEKNEFAIGTALHSVKNPANDMPQTSGRLQNCSSSTFKCRAIAGLVFVVPKNGADSEYRAGPRIILRRLENGGWHGSATCSTFTQTGCASQVDMSRLLLEYEYEVDPRGVLTSLKIKNWDGKQKLLSSQNLVLMSRVGLKLD